MANPTGERCSFRPPLGGIRSLHEQRSPITVFVPHRRERRTGGTSGDAPSGRGIASCGAGTGKKASPGSTVEMIGSPFVTRRELQQLLPCADEATLAGQLAQPVRHFSIVGPVNRQVTVPWLVHG